MIPRGIVYLTYIIAENEDGMYIIDQHAAAERINYEKVLKALKETTNIIDLLVPIKIELSTPEFLSIKQNFEHIKEHGLSLKKGAVELLTFLKEKGIQTAVATATDLERTKKYLTELGIVSYFDELVSATMVEYGKPAPDIYQYACKQLGRKPEECMAVEDSPNGVTSAYLAGCKVVMVPDQTQPDEETKKMLYAKVESLLGICNFFDI